MTLHVRQKATEMGNNCFGLLAGCPLKQKVTLVGQHCPLVFNFKQDFSALTYSWTG